MTETGLPTPRLTFADGHSIPQLGLGVWQVPAEDTAAVVETALDAGYRHIDTARGYDNEAGVGEGLRRADVPREEVFVTSKCPNQDQGYEAALASFDASMADLGLDYLDLYLIHWPCPEKGLTVETWQALVELQRQGRVRSIGVSNFRDVDIEAVVEATGVVPALNQIELHPYFAQAAAREDHARRGILTESWSPLGQGGGELEDPVVAEIARAHEASPAQVVLAWNLALGNVVIPKSVTPSRIAQNLAALALPLTADEVARISGLDRGEDGRRGKRPDAFEGHQGS